MITITPAAEGKDMKLEFLLIDVFTDQPFGGSRLYLFPGGGDVPEELMQKLAMELGPGDGVVRGDVDVLGLGIEVDLADLGNASELLFFRRSGEPGFTDDVGFLEPVVRRQ